MWWYYLYRTDDLCCGMGMHILEPLPFAMPAILEYYGNHPRPDSNDHLHAFTNSFS